MSTGLLPPLGSTLTEGLAAGLAITALRGLALAACGSHPGTAGAPTIAPKDWEPSWAYGLKCLKCISFEIVKLLECKEQLQYPKK